jgi:hypothetical protein
VHRGIDEIRACHRQLTEDLPNARYEYKTVVVEQSVGFLEWSADSDAGRVDTGVDSYVIGDGYIRAQTVHYALVRSSIQAQPSQD